MSDISPEGQPISTARHILEATGRNLMEALAETGMSLPQAQMGTGSAIFTTERLGMNLAEQRKAIAANGEMGKAFGDKLADWLNL